MLVMTLRQASNLKTIIYVIYQYNPKHTFGGFQIAISPFRVRGQEKQRFSKIEKQNKQKKENKKIYNKENKRKN